PSAAVLHSFTPLLPIPTISTHSPYTTLFRSEFAKNEWSIKRLHRLIVTSDTYKQSTAKSENPWLQGFPRQRLDGETLRDAMLASDRKSTRLNSSHVKISYAVFCLKKKTISHE